MHSIHDIVDWINEQIIDFVPSAKMYGIAHTVKRGGEIIQVVGERDVSPDDIYPLQAYHKQNTLSSRVVPRTGYGDNTNYLLNTHNNSLLIFFNYKKCDFTVDELYTFIQATINQTLKRDGYKLVTIDVTGAILNDAQVWASEYGETPIRLKDTQRLISIGYSVSFTLDKTCIVIPNCKN